MSNSSQENAMTEIALAMAMGFFSVMVLTAISMGVPAPKTPMKQSASVSIAVLAQNNATAGSGKASKLNKKDVLVVYDGKQYRDRELNALDPTTLRNAERVVLAVTSDLSMSAAMQAQKGLSAKKVVITTLDSKWNQALREKTNDR